MRPAGLLLELHRREGRVVAADRDAAATTFRRSSEMTVFSRCCGFLVGLAREMPMCEPPRKWMRLTSSMVSGVTWSTFALHDPLEAVADAEDLDALEPGADGGGADDAVDAGGGAAADEDGEFLRGAHVGPPFSDRDPSRRVATLRFSPAIWRNGARSRKSTRRGGNAPAPSPWSLAPAPCHLDPLRRTFYGNYRPSNVILARGKHKSLRPKSWRRHKAVPGVLGGI